MLVDNLRGYICFDDKERKIKEEKRKERKEVKICALVYTLQILVLVCLLISIGRFWRWERDWGVFSLILIYFCLKDMPQC